MPKDDYKYENYDLDTFLDYRTKLGNSYFALEATLNAMNTYLRRAEEYPAQVSKDEGGRVQMFLEEAGFLLREHFVLFARMSEE